ncbi:flagellar biosynthesis anti-sigma factor FlgM [Psychrobium sp. 1_MG-2023]|uniref:flagellar biosynthesis anti-sigma factor FlgM n=1 Tax=Psychrobium sp. 1_MG-2023 TaxID=3062624 RepID=UPI000C3204BD|nr:flagellar biosynthesis anti-sigma factor FlgM [Psychrobium sp. 1_MG-2023]MDP2559877.1 flagellar biosynthesis anti-sigma factor FlgM [Psychrobium sp. 1_MG-2023]PKF59022.1 flagellar biosynthesis anti-sigma factor FlgM [Alteromonadales bacterium alter-6D02]
MAIDINKLAGNHSQQLDSLKNKSQNNATEVKQQNVQQQSQTQAQSQPQAKDSVSLTKQAQQLHGIREKLNNTSSVNQEKVESIRKAIASGDYKVDPEKLAANLAKFEGDLEKIF